MNNREILIAGMITNFIAEAKAQEASNQLDKAIYNYTQAMEAAIRIDDDRYYDALFLRANVFGKIDVNSIEELKSEDQFALANDDLECAKLYNQTIELFKNKAFDEAKKAFLHAMSLDLLGRVIRSDQVVNHKEFISCLFQLVNIENKNILSNAGSLSAVKNHLINSNHFNLRAERLFDVKAYDDAYFDYVLAYWLNRAGFCRSSAHYSCFILGMIKCDIMLNRYYNVIDFFNLIMHSLSTVFEKPNSVVDIPWLRNYVGNVSLILINQDSLIELGSKVVFEKIINCAIEQAINNSQSSYIEAIANYSLVLYALNQMYPELIIIANDFITEENIQSKDAIKNVFVDAAESNLIILISNLRESIKEIIGETLILLIEREKNNLLVHDTNPAQLGINMFTNLINRYFSSSQQPIATPVLDQVMQNFAFAKQLESQEGYFENVDLLKKAVLYLDKAVKLGAQQNHGMLAAIFAARSRNKYYLKDYISAIEDSESSFKLSDVTINTFYRAMISTKMKLHKEARKHFLNYIFGDDKAAVLVSKQKEFLDAWCENEFFREKDLYARKKIISPKKLLKSTNQEESQNEYALSDFFESKAESPEDYSNYSNVVALFARSKEYLKRSYFLQLAVDDLSLIIWIVASNNCSVPNFDVTQVYDARLRVFISRGLIDRASLDCEELIHKVCLLSPAELKQLTWIDIARFAKEFDSKMQSTEFFDAIKKHIKIDFASNCVISAKNLIKEDHFVTVYKLYRSALLSLENYYQAEIDLIDVEILNSLADYIPDATLDAKPKKVILEDIKKLSNIYNDIINPKPKMIKVIDLPNSNKICVKEQVSPKVNSPSLSCPSVLFKPTVGKSRNKFKSNSPVVTKKEMKLIEDEKQREIERLAEAFEKNRIEELKLKLSAKQDANKLKRKANREKELEAKAERIRLKEIESSQDEEKENKQEQEKINRDLALIERENQFKANNAAVEKKMAEIIAKLDAASIKNKSKSKLKDNGPFIEEEDLNSISPKSADLPDLKSDPSSESAESALPTSEYLKSFLVDKTLNKVGYQPVCDYLKRIRDIQIKAGNKTPLTFLVGGTTRNIQAGKSHLKTDLDPVTDATQAQVEEAFPEAVVREGSCDAGTILIVTFPNGYKLEILLSLALLDDSLSIEERMFNDAKARKLTMNALYLDAFGELFAPLKTTISDIANLKFRIDGDMLESFILDPILILKIIKLSSNFEVDLLENNLLMVKAMSVCSPYIYQKVPLEKINFQLQSLFCQGKAVMNHDKLIRYGVLDHVFPTRIFGSDNISYRCALNSHWLTNQLCKLDARYNNEKMKVSVNRIYMIYIVASIFIDWNSYQDLSLLSNRFINENPLFAFNFKGCTYIDSLRDSVIFDYLKYNSEAERVIREQALANILFLQQQSAAQQAQAFFTNSNVAENVPVTNNMLPEPVRNGNPL